LVSCKMCNYKTGDKCWLYGKMTLGEQLKKRLRGCENYRPWWMMDSLPPYQ
jgi:hypothetical protein